MVFALKDGCRLVGRGVAQFDYDVVVCADAAFWGGFGGVVRKCRDEDFRMLLRDVFRHEIDEAQQMSRVSILVQLFLA